METQPDLTLAKTNNDNNLSNVQPTIDYSKLPPEVAMATTLGNSGVLLGAAITNAIQAGLNANAQVKASKNQLEAKQKELEAAKLALETAQTALKAAEEATKQVTAQEGTKQKDAENRLINAREQRASIEKIETQKINVAKYYAETQRLAVNAFIETRKVETQILLGFAQTHPEFALQLMKLSNQQSNPTSALLLAAPNGPGMYSPRAGNLLEASPSEELSNSNLPEYK